MAGLSEFGGGILLALCLLGPVGALGVIAAMLVAIIAAHWGKFFSTQGGMEYPLTLAIAALATLVLIVRGVEVRRSADAGH